MKGQIHMRRLPRLAGPILALRYRRAAQWDESHGFSLTAAMEWRMAAELSAWITPLANRYWREWERIMHLSRRLAVPIGIADVVPIAPLKQSSPSLVEFPPSMAPHQSMLQTAA
jgi:hypothetical protein